MRLLLGIALLSLSATVGAEVTPNSLFAGHAVLQRNAVLPVWGTAQGLNF
jgi:hypothetical protein